MAGPVLMQCLRPPHGHLREGISSSEMALCALREELELLGRMIRDKHVVCFLNAGPHVYFVSFGVGEPKLVEPSQGNH